MSPSVIVVSPTLGETKVEALDGIRHAEFTAKEYVVRLNGTTANISALPFGASQPFAASAT